jgi:putative ABC transport system substrate-binding protein
MKRRTFIAGLGSAAAWSIGVRAQQAAVPVVGFLSVQSVDDDYTNKARRPFLTGFHRGLAEKDYVEGRNLAVEHRWTEDHNERALVADLVDRRVAVIAAVSTASALAAKAATQTIPIVFAIGSDPVAMGLVASLNRPGGNLTGITALLNELMGKRLELLHALVPAATSVALLVNPSSRVVAEADVKEAKRAARILGVNLLVLNASNTSAIDAAFAAMASRRIGALITNTDDLFRNERDRLAMLAVQYAVPAIYAYRPNAVAGGLMSYGTDNFEAGRQIGLYTGRVLKGEKPSDLPVQQSTKFELVINLKTAKALGLTIPETLLATADEVIQ